MRTMSRWVQSLITIGLIASVVTGWRIFREMETADLTEAEVVAAQEQQTTKEPAPNPENEKRANNEPTDKVTEEPYPPPAVTPWYQPLLTKEPTPTIPPVPTRRPTPIATKIPLAEPPFIDGLPDGEQLPYTLLYPEDNRTSIKAVDVDASQAVERPPIALPVNIAPEAVEVDAASNNTAGGPDIDSDQTYLPAVVAPNSVDAAALSNSDAEESLYIVNDRYYTSWGAASPIENQVALVLRNYPEERTLHNQAAPYHKDKPFQYSLHLLNLSTNQMEHLVNGGVDPVWSPDGTRIVYRNNADRGLWLLDLKSKTTKKLVGFEEGTEYTTDWIAWSPDSQQIAYVKTADNFINIGGLWVYDLRAQQTNELIESGFSVASLQWSPTSSEILFATEKGEKLIDDNLNHLWKIDIESGQRTQLTHNMSVVDYLWSPDGEWVAFIAINILEDEGMQWDLWLSSKNGNTLKRLTNDFKYEQLIPGSFSHTAITYIATDPNTGKSNGIWEVALTTGISQQLAQKNTENNSIPLFLANNR